MRSRACARRAAEHECVRGSARQEWAKVQGAAARHAHLAFPNYAIWAALECAHHAAILAPELDVGVRFPLCPHGCPAGSRGQSEATRAGHAEAAPRHARCPRRASTRHSTHALNPLRTSRATHSALRAMSDRTLAPLARARKWRLPVAADARGKAQAGGDACADRSHPMLDHPCTRELIPLLLYLAHVHSACRAAGECGGGGPAAGDLPRRAGRRAGRWRRGAAAGSRRAGCAAGAEAGGFSSGEPARPRARAGPRRRRGAAR